MIGADAPLILYLPRSRRLFAVVTSIVFGVGCVSALIAARFFPSTEDDRIGGLFVALMCGLISAGFFRFTRQALHLCPDGILFVNFIGKRWIRLEMLSAFQPLVITKHVGHALVRVPVIDLLDSGRRRVARIDHFFEPRPELRSWLKARLPEYKEMDPWEEVARLTLSSSLPPSQGGFRLKKLFPILALILFLAGFAVGHLPIQSNEKLLVILVALGFLCMAGWRCRRCGALLGAFSNQRCPRCALEI